MVKLYNDFENFCEADITEVGTYFYARHPSNEPLMCAYAFDDDNVEQWVPAEGQKMPRNLKDGLRDPEVIKSAWHAAYEKAIWEYVLGEDIFQDEWRCTQARAMSLSLPAALDKAGEVVGLGAETAKDAEGKKLIKLFCQPLKPTKKFPFRRANQYTHPEEWERFKHYNRQDIRAERGIDKRTKKWDLPPEEWETYWLDQEINHDGIPLNMAVVKNAIAFLERYRDLQLLKMRAISGIDNPRSNQQLLAYLKDNGYRFNDVKKGHIVIASEDKTLAPDVREFLRIRLEVARTSPDKFYAMDRSQSDGVVQGAFKFCGAQRTWRWSGTIFQPQNLPRPDAAFEKEQEYHVENIRRLSPRALELVYPKPMDLLASSVRNAVQAPEGQLIISGDLNAIENRVLGYMSQDQKILDVFRNGRDPYVDFAQYLFDSTYYEEWALYKGDPEKGIDGQPKHRKISKPGVLGCFGTDTPVLTDKGWKRIVDIKHDDLVHDGESFVKHDGVAYRGDKEVLRWLGIYATPDHEIETTGQWVQCQSVNRPRSIRAAQNLANGRLYDSLERLVQLARNTSVDARVGLKELLVEATSPLEKAQAVRAVLQRLDVVNSESASGAIFSTYSLIVSMLQKAAARTRTIQLTHTTAGAAFVSGSVMLSSMSRTSLMFLGQTELSKLIESKMTEITEKGISVWRPEASKTATSATWDVINAGPNHRYVILTDAGPMIASNCGYMLSAGEEKFNEDTGEKEATGLLGYAWNMGVKEFTLADSKLSVDVWRETFEDAVAYWWEIEKAAKKCLRHGNPTSAGPVRFDISGPFMRMILPSSRPGQKPRCIHYCRPRIDVTQQVFCQEQRKYLPLAMCKRPDKSKVRNKESISYEGLNDKNQWGRIWTHPGKLTENGDQAISRDILATAMRRWRRRAPRKWSDPKMQAFGLRLHVHDEAGAIVYEQYAEEAAKLLHECLTEPMWWASEKELPLGIGPISKTRVWIKD